MKPIILSLAGLLLFAGCETKVVNQPPSTGQPAVIERDHPVVVPENQPQPQPAVENNIHVDHP